MSNNSDEFYEKVTITSGTAASTTQTYEVSEDYFVTLVGGSSVSIDSLTLLTNHGFNLYKYDERVPLAGLTQDANGARQRRRRLYLCGG